MGFNHRIYLVDIEPILDIESGKNKLQIVRETPVYADLQEVGLNEYYSAASNKIVLSATYEIPASSYHGEKYILTNNRTKQFEVFRTAKGRTPSYIKLPVKVVQKASLLEGMTSG